MRCPKCKNADSKVLDSRTTDDGLSIRRRRECEKCEKRFTTYEKLEFTSFIVVKKDGTREPYSREKLERGIWAACTKRPVTEQMIEDMVQELELKWASNQKEVSSSRIGKDVMDKLRKMDEIAYVRFASVYQDFKTIEEFKNIVESKIN